MATQSLSKLIPSCPMYKFCIRHLYYATACNAMHAMAIRKPSVSVCPSVKRMDCDKTKETCVYILVPHERSFILVYW